jgi:hypothetical protein
LGGQSRNNKRVDRPEQVEALAVPGLYPNDLRHTGNDLRSLQASLWSRANGRHNESPIRRQGDLAAATPVGGVAAPRYSKQVGREAEDLAAFRSLPDHGDVWNIVYGS